MNRDVVIVLLSVIAGLLILIATFLIVERNDRRSKEAADELEREVMGAFEAAERKEAERSAKRRREAGLRP